MAICQSFQNLLKRFEGSKLFKKPVKPIVPNLPSLHIYPCLLKSKHPNTQKVILNNLKKETYNGCNVWDVCGGSVIKSNPTLFVV